MISASNRARTTLSLGALAVCCGAVAASGCGARDHAIPVTGRHSYDVVAHPTMATNAFPANLPETVSFSLTLDADAGLLVVGGVGSAQVVPTARDGDTFRATMPVQLSVMSQSCGQGLTSLDYSSFEVSVTEATLTGTAGGLAEIGNGDVLSDVELTATLAGGPDVTPPSLIAPTGAVTSPFETFALSASEALPESATARLVASDGSQLDLVPIFVDGPLKVISAFEKPPVVLHPGSGYAVAMGGLVDFAGHTAVEDAPLRVVMIPAAPLIADGGFESVTGSSPGAPSLIGGASLVTAGGPLPPIAGAVSVYIGQPHAPSLGAVAPGTGLFVRVPRKATDTKLRFSYVVVSLTAIPAVENNLKVYVGSSDGPAAVGSIPSAVPLPSDVTAETNGGVVQASAVSVMEVPLADASASDLVVSIGGQEGSDCGPSGPVEAGFLGFLIDDLRAE